MANPSPVLNPNPPKFVTGAQIKGGRALLGWRRADLAEAAGLHVNSIAYWEGQQRMPRSEPFACHKIRAALLWAGVVTVSTPAPGVCLLSLGRRPVSQPSSPIPSPQISEGAGHRLITAFNGQGLCTMHSALTVSTAWEQEHRSTSLDCGPDTKSPGECT